MEWKFLIERESGWYVMQVILPDVILVLISCIGYWLHPDKHVNGRLILSIGCLLALLPVHLISRQSCTAGYIVTHDCWTLACFILVAISFAELLLVHVLMRFMSKPPGRLDQVTLTLTSFSLIPFFLQVKRKLVC